MAADFNSIVFDALVLNIHHRHKPFRQFFPAIGFLFRSIVRKTRIHGSTKVSAIDRLSLRHFFSSTGCSFTASESVDRYKASKHRSPHAVPLTLLSILRSTVPRNVSGIDRLVVSGFHFHVRVNRARRSTRSVDEQ